MKMAAEKNKKNSGLDSLVEEIFVDHSRNVKQGISHPKECVFTGLGGGGDKNVLYYAHTRSPALHEQDTNHLW